MHKETCPFPVRSTHRWITRLLMAGFLWCAGAGLGPAGALAEQPTEPVARLHDQLVTVMQAGASLGFLGRLEQLLPVVRESFNLPLMTQVSVGSTWRSLSDPERDRLITLFTRFTGASYAANFDSYNGERFEILQTHLRGNDRAVVETRLTPGSNKRDPVELHYLLQKSADQWQVIDVLLKGRISQLAARRSEFASILRRTGVDGLAQALQDKIQNLSTGAKGGLLDEQES